MALPRSRIAYFIIFSIQFILVSLSRCLQSEILFLCSLTTFSHCNDRNGISRIYCVQTTAVTRLTFGYSLVHFILAVLFFPRKGGSPHLWQYKLQYKLWWLKILALVASLALSLLAVPIDFFFIYWYIGTVGGGIFLFIQIVLLVDFSYTWHESWAESYAPKWNPLLIVATLVFYLFSAGAAVGLYFSFVTVFSNCIINFSIILETVVMCIVFSVISAIYKIERGSLFISSILTFYLMLLTLTALAISDDCKSKKMESISYIFVIVVSSIFTVFSIGYSSMYYFVAPRKIKEPYPGTEDTNDTQSSIASEDQRHPHHHYGTLTIAGSPGPRRREIIESLRENLIGEKRSYNFTKFHLVFCFGGMYLGMAFTSWENYNKTLIFWIEVSVQMITVILYIWCLVAPLFIKELQLPIGQEQRRVLVDVNTNLVN